MSELFEKTRITVGTLKNRNVKFLAKDGLRPTKGRIRQAIFNIIYHRFFLDKFDSICFLDAFSGTGIFGIEAVSLGAKYVICVDIDKNTTDMIAQNARDLKIEHKLQIYNSNIFEFESDKIFNLIFLDPPYFKGLIPKMLEKIITQPIFVDGAIIVTESSCADVNEIDASATLLGAELLLHRRYGKISVMFYRKRG